MKKTCCIILIILILLVPQVVYSSAEDILQEQTEELNISSFIQEADKYTQNIFPELNIGELFNSAITGKIDNGII